VGCPARNGHGPIAPHSSSCVCVRPCERLKRSGRASPCTSPVSALTPNVRDCLVRSWQYRDAYRRGPIHRPVIAGRLARSGIGVSVPMHSPACEVRSSCAGGPLSKLFASGLPTNGPGCCHSRASSVTLFESPEQPVKAGQSTPPSSSAFTSSAGQGLTMRSGSSVSQVPLGDFLQDLSRTPCDLH
jgi:hypothetical protein